MKARTGGEKGRHLRPRLVQKMAEGKTSFELSWRVKVMMENKHVQLVRGTRDEVSHAACAHMRRCASTRSEVNRHVTAGVRAVSCLPFLCAA